MGLTHDVRGKHNNCRVAIYATPPGSGSKGGARGPAPFPRDARRGNVRPLESTWRGRHRRLGRRIMTQLGFSSFTIKGRGRRTPYSFVAATFDALSNHNSVRDIAMKRGRRILEIEYALAARAKSRPTFGPGGNT